ncbi:hypothetical protein GIB67_038453 [Kingdonia uniflora]|uniref:Uncharacterized protein n=1 Tax=Kingdonia uniflora TaxID=39325 RepID=A0A7J7NP62_9MAGN|nr:hypothetical protein GIB67_038453 [Kingdonia uniflora]
MMLSGHKASVKCPRWIPNCKRYIQREFLPVYLSVFRSQLQFSWKSSSPDSHNGAADHQQSTVVFPKGNLLPSVKALTFYRSGNFRVDVIYSDMKVPVAKEPTKETAKMVTDAHPNEESSGTAESGLNMQDASVVDNGDPERWRIGYREDETKGVYVAKFVELKKQGVPIEACYKVNLERGLATDQLRYCIASFRDEAMPSSPKFDHSDIADKKVISECVKAEGWSREKQQQQDSLPKHVAPVLIVGDVKRRAETLEKLFRPIMTKTRPAVKSPSPEIVPSPSHQESTEPQQSQGGESNSHPDSVEPMDTEKSQG